MQWLGHISWGGRLKCWVRGLLGISLEGDCLGVN
jgi:hypothetical protein